MFNNKLIPLKTKIDKTYIQVTKHNDYIFTQILPVIMPANMATFLAGHIKETKKKNNLKDNIEIITNIYNQIHNEESDSNTADVTPPKSRSKK